MTRGKDGLKIWDDKNALILDFEHVSLTVVQLAIVARECLQLDPPLAPFAPSPCTFRSFELQTNAGQQGQFEEGADILIVPRAHQSCAYRL